MATMMEWHGERQATLTEDQRASNKAMFQAMLADPEKMASVKADFEKQFQEADSNGDGTLTLAEFLVYNEKSIANAKEKGWTVPDNDQADFERWWKMMCDIAGTPNGISKADMQSINGQVMTVVAAKMLQ